MEWKEPPYTKARPQGNPLLSDEDIAQLRAKPGQWALVKDYDSQKNAITNAASMRKTQRYKGLEFLAAEGAVYVRCANEFNPHMGTPRRVS